MKLKNLIKENKELKKKNRAILTRLRWGGVLFCVERSVRPF